MDSGQPTADSGPPAISLIHRMNAVDFLYHPVQAAGAVGREDMKKGVPFFFALEMGINEDRARFRFVAVQNVKFRGVDEAVEVSSPVLFQSEGEEAMDGVAEHGAVHIHRIPFHHAQILETLQPVFGSLAGHKYLFPQFRHGNAAVFLQLLNNFSVRIIQFFRNHGFFPFLFPYYIIAGKGGQPGSADSFTQRLMIPTHAGARDFPILPAAGPRHAGQYQKSTYAAGKSRIFSTEDHAPHRSEKRI